MYCAACILYFQCSDHIQPLPRQIKVAAIEMTVGGGLRAYRSTKSQPLNNRGRPKIEMLVDDSENRFIRQLTRAKSGLPAGKHNTPRRWHRPSIVICRQERKNAWHITTALFSFLPLTMFIN
jgi:hypothetical protein